MAIRVLLPLQTKRRMRIEGTRRVTEVDVILWHDLFSIPLPAAGKTIPKTHRIRCVQRNTPGTVGNLLYIVTAA